MSRLVRQQVGAMELLGFSLAGEETVVIVPELNIAFDFGRAPRELVAIDHVCLSHGHMDHAAGLAYYFSQRQFVGNSAGCAIMHPDLVPPVRRLLDAWAEIERHPSPATLVGLRAGVDHAIRRDLVVRAFDVVHPGPALGFVVLEVRNKLKPEFAGLSGPQLVDLKKKGVEIEYRLEVPRVAYCGDTAAGPFLERDDVRNAEVLLLECTFFDEDHVRRARAGQHMHVRDLRDVMPLVNSPHVVLMHFTRRTALKQARIELARVLGAKGVERVRLLMDRPPRSAPRPDRPAP